MSNIEVSKIIDPIPASDGAGVKLKRSIGVDVDNQKNNHFVMDHIKELSLLHWHIRQKKQKKCFSVHVNKLTTHHSVMVHIINKL